MISVWQLKLKFYLYFADFAIFVNWFIIISYWSNYVWKVLCFAYLDEKGFPNFSADAGFFRCEATENR